jgi:hypothetical protein
VSYNHIYNYQKVSLNGHSDSATEHSAARTTYYRNRFENVEARLPLQRFGLSHMANNYFGNVATSGINIRMGAVSLVEANYFENIANPVTSRDSSQIGYWDLRNNYVGAGITWTSGSSGTVNATNWQTTKAFPEALPYSLNIASAAQVKCLVFATAGAATNLATSAPQCTGGAASINLTARATSTDISLTWTTANLTSGAQEVYRDTDADPSGRGRIGTVGSSTRSFNDTTASTGVTYYYWVKNTTNGVVTNSNTASARR